MSYGINHQVPVKAPPEHVCVVLTETGKLTLRWTCESGGRAQGQLDSHPAGEAATEHRSRRKLSALRILKR
jgi:hypothetical protein